MADIYPESRVEEILVSMINGEEYTKFPESRIEALLIELLGKIIEVEGRGAYEFKGSVDFDELPETLTPDMAGWTYNMAESFITDNRFVDGAGKVYPQGTNVSIANVGTDEDPDMMFDVPSAFVDVSAIYASINKVIADIAPEFSIESPYHENDLVIYNEILYIFTTDHAAGEFNPLEVEQTDVNRLLASVYNEIDLLAQTISGISESIPRNLSDLTEDSTHRTVTDTEKSTWNSKQSNVNLTLTPDAVVSDRDVTDGSGNTLSVVADSVSTPKTATGTPVIVEDALESNATGLVAQIVPIQSGSGDPSPENVRPISGRTEVNLGRTGKNLAYLEQGTISTTTGDESESTTRVRTQFIPIEQGVTYIASSQNNGWSVRNGVGYDENFNFVANTIYPHAETGLFVVNNPSIKYVRFVYSHSNTSETCAPSDYWYQFEIGSTATPYEEYKGQSITIALGTTVYGGTLDVKTGVLTITDVIVDLGDIEWTYESSKDFFKVTMQSTFKLNSNLVCSIYPYKGQRNDGNMDTAEYGIYDVNTTLKVKDTQYTDAATYTTAVTGQKLVYELATPTTIQLTGAELALLMGYNRITSDSGDITLTYKANAVQDLQTDKADNADMVDYIENGNKASRAYTANQFMLWKGDLYKVTTSIASGATITAGTNVTKTTIGAVLTALLNA